MKYHFNLESVSKLWMRYLTLFIYVFKIQGRTFQFSLVEFEVASDYYIGQCSPVGLVLNAVANSDV